MIVEVDTGDDLIARAKWSFTARRQPRGEAVQLLPDVTRGRPGDLLLGRVERVGQHKRLQLAEGRYADLWPGDLVVVACAARYAVDQFEAVAALAPDRVDLVAGGGAAGQMVAKHARMSSPTRLRPLGLLADRTGTPLNVARHALPPVPAPTGLPVIAILGTSMNSGKTTAAAALVHGLGRSGIATGAAKVTGTGSFGDVMRFVNAGAHAVCDFTDAGMASTAGEPLSRIEASMETCLAHLAGRGCTAIVIEVADGIFQNETDLLLRSPRFQALVGGVVFAAGDACSAVYGNQVLVGDGLDVIAITGAFTASPLARREAEPHLSAPIFGSDDLVLPEIASALFDAVRTETTASAA